MRALPLFFEELRRILPAAWRKEQQTDHSGMIMIYWKIGQRIVEGPQKGENRAGYGYYLVKEFSDLLCAEFGKGFSIANIKNFRQFYLCFPERSISETVRKELSWTHYRIVMRLYDPAARQYFITRAAEEKWSTRQLEQKIKNSPNLKITHTPITHTPPPPKKTTSVEIIQSILMEIPIKRLPEPRGQQPSGRQEWRIFSSWQAKHSNFQATTH